MLMLYPTGLALVAHFLSASPVPVSDVPYVLPLRERAELHDRLLEERLDTLLPPLMRRAGVDAWVLFAREYNEDPVLETMLPASWMSARRRTMLVFALSEDGEEVERAAVARYAVGDLFPSVWDPESQPDQWARLAEWLSERDPQRIAIDSSSTFALADGASASELDALRAALPPTLVERLVPADALCIGWLETRTESELEIYPSVAAIAHAILAEAFSAQAVQPGVTTTADLEWWLRERAASLDLDVWFHPSVSVQRAADPEHGGSFASDPGAEIIHRGDLVHVDFGIRYLDLCTDTQWHAYVLRPGESEAPAGLVAGLKAANRVQELLNAEFATGRSGNAILAAARAAAIGEGLEPTIYTHPLGLHGHGAGPTIGLWDQQGGVPGRGDYPVYPSTGYSIELNAAHRVPEWGDKRVLFMLEEDAWFDGERVRWLDGRQTEFALIP